MNAPGRADAATLVDGASLVESRTVDDALALVAAVPDSDESLERDRILIRHLIAGRDESATRTTRPGHLTGSAFVVDSTATHALLLFHTKLQRWLQPGGHADGDMNLVRVAWREATEESGIEGLRIDPAPIDLDIHRVAPPAEDAHLHLDVRFLVVAPPGAQPVANEESEAMLWVVEADLANYDLDAGLRRLSAAAFARARALISS
ncbi:MAG: NUDIX domain-containing protein [Actinobacteria bacterium]|nr:NUDIX domain-containing protein [Actinomycetota bacterium]